MAIAWGALGTAEDENNTIDTPTTAVSVATPPTWVDDDLGLFLSVVDGDTDLTTYPSGWTERIDFLPAAFSSRCRLFIATADVADAGSPPGTSFTYTPDADNGDGYLQMARITGVTNADPFDVTYVEGDHADDGNNNTPVISAITTVTDGALAVLIIGFRNGDAPISSHPSGWTLREEVSGSSDKYYAIYTQEKATAGTISSTTATLTASGRWSTVVFALEPASTGTNVNAEAVSLAFAAPDPTPSVAPSAEAASMAMSAPDAEVSISPSAELATAIFEVLDPRVDITTTAELAEAALVALDATVSTASATNADAEVAEMTFAALAAEIDLRTAAEAVTLALQALDPAIDITESTDASAEAVTLVLSAPEPAVAIAPTAEVATMVLSGLNATASVTVTATEFGELTMVLIELRSIREGSTGLSLEPLSSEYSMRRL